MNSLFERKKLWRLLRSLRNSAEQKQTISQPQTLPKFFPEIVRKVTDENYPLLWRLKYVKYNPSTQQRFGPEEKTVLQKELGMEYRIIEEGTVELRFGRSIEGFKNGMSYLPLYRESCHLT